jgi:KDO2-lipid IV(A) lauroyltransferase
VGDRTRKALKRRKRRGFVLGFVLRVISYIVRHLPLSVVHAVGIGLGTWGYYTSYVILPRYRSRAMQNISRAFPDWPRARHRRTIRRMAQHMGMTLMEILWMPHNASKALAVTAIENAEPVIAHINAGRGIAAFTGHCGNWEWLAYGVTTIKPLTALQRERNEPALNEFITELRAMVGITTVDRGSGSRELLRALRRGEILGFLIDQNIRAASVKVPFFGRPALTPIGAAQLAVREAAVVVSVFIERRDGRQIIRFNEPRIVARTDDPVAVTAQITREIEEHIRRFPEQWMWMHERWKERPKWEMPATTRS